MGTYCCCTVYTLLSTLVQFVLYQQLLLEYSRMFLALCTVLFAFPPPALNKGRGKTTQRPHLFFFNHIKNVRKQCLLQIEK